LKAAEKYLFRAFPCVVFNLYSILSSQWHSIVACLFLFILPKSLLLFVFIFFLRYNSVGFLAVQTLSLYFQTPQMVLVCGQYLWHSMWTLLISSTFFLTWLFIQVRPGISSYKVPLVAGCSFIKPTCSGYCPFSAIQNRHNLREPKRHFYCRFTMLYYASEILKFLCLPCFSLT